MLADDIKKVACQVLLARPPVCLLAPHCERAIRTHILLSCRVIAGHGASARVLTSIFSERLSKILLNGQRTFKKLGRSVTVLQPPKALIYTRSAIFRKKRKQWRQKRLKLF